MAKTWDKYYNQLRFFWFRRELYGNYIRVFEEISRNNKTLFSLRLNFSTA
jgi:hypothetical protein